MTREEARKELWRYSICSPTREIREAIDMAISALSAEHKDCTDFLCWLLEEIMDEENWEINADANGEIIARKLKKLGLLDSKDRYYIRTPMYEALTEPSDLISRHEALQAINGACSNWQDDATVAEIIQALPSVKKIAENCENLKPLWATECVSAERSTLVVPLKYPCDDCKWWNPQVNRCNKDEATKDIYTHSESVSAERGVGEWERVDEQPYFRKHYHTVCCSVCHKKGNEKYNYCPNCGAKMKGGTE